MKLPKGKKERIQILVVVLIAVVGLFYALIAFAIMPNVKEGNDAKDQIAALRVQIDKASNEISKAAPAPKEMEEIKARLREIDETYILKPEIDYYFGRAETYAKSLGPKCNVNIRSIAKGVKATTPRSSKNKFGNIAMAFTCKIDLLGSYEDARKVLSRIREENPYCMVSKLRISSKNDPEVHSLQFELYFPIWVNENIVSKFQAVDLDKKKRKAKT